MSQKPMRQRVEELEEQVFTLSSFIIAIGDLLEEKQIFTKADMVAASKRVSNMRMQGVSYSNRKRYENVAERLILPGRDGFNFSPNSN